MGALPTPRKRPPREEGLIATLMLRTWVPNLMEAAADVWSCSGKELHAILPYSVRREQLWPKRLVTGQVMTALELFHCAASACNSASVSLSLPLHTACGRHGRPQRKELPMANNAFLALIGMAAERADVDWLGLRYSGHFFLNA